MLLEARRLSMWKKISQERLRAGSAVSIPIGIERIAQK
jgi:hypothetical protein